MCTWCFCNLLECFLGFVDWHVCVGFFVFLFGLVDCLIWILIALYDFIFVVFTIIEFMVCFIDLVVFWVFMLIGVCVGCYVFDFLCLGVCYCLGCFDGICGWVWFIVCILLCNFELIYWYCVWMDWWLISCSWVYFVGGCFALRLFCVVIWFADCFFFGLINVIVMFALLVLFMGVCMVCICCWLAGLFLVVFYLLL